MQDRELENVGIPIRWRIYLDPTQEREKELKVDSFFFAPVLSLLCLSQIPIL